MGHDGFISRVKADWLAEEAAKIWDYSQNSPTGLIWRIKRAGTKGPGSPAGGRQTKYHSVRNLGVYYYCHHVVWTLINGKIPEAHVIDHIDRDGHNNEISNLKLKTVSDNAKNQNPKGQSKFKGVSWFARDKKWLARLGSESGPIFLGYFDTPEEAALVWDRAAVAQGRNREDLNFPDLRELN